MPLVNKTFSDIVTFDRASSATMFDSSGTLVYAPMNAIRNSTGVGAVAGVIGSGGAAPTNWTIASSASGLTREIIGTGTENGITYIDLKVSGTSTSSGTIQITPETTTGVAALTGQTWTGASYLKLVGGSFPSTVAWIWIERDSGGGVVVTASAVPFGPPDGSALNTQRYSNTRTLSGGASVAYVTLRLDLTIPNSTVVDFTIRIGLPQLELGSVARTAVATSGTAYQGPRLDYDPATLAAQGLLIEEQRTNLFTYSEQFDNADWTKTRSSITADAAVSPDGTMDGDKLIEDTADGAHIIRFANGSYTAGTTYTISFYVKAAERNTCRIQFRSAAFTGNGGVSFDLVNVTATAEIAYATGTIAAVGNGWFRVTATSTATTTYSGVEGFYFYIGTATYPGDGTSGIYIWGAQLEAGAFPTSYIPTTTTSLTRSADVASVNTLSPWYNAAEGTLFVRAAVGSAAATGIRLAALDDGTSSNIIRFASGAVSFQVLNAGSVEASLGLATLTDNVAANMTGAYKANDFAASINGGAVVTDNSGTLPTVDRLILGSASGTNPRQTWIQRLTYYPRRLSNAELQALTT